MKKLAFITGSPRKADPVRGVVMRATEKLKAKLTSVDAFQLDEPLAKSLWQMLKQADVVIADASEASPNLLYEIGIAHGLGKPVVVLSTFGARGIPTSLAGIQVLEYSSHERGLEILRFRLTELLQEQFATNAAIPTLAPKATPKPRQRNIKSDVAFADIVELTGRERSQAFEEWFFKLANAIPAWDVIAGDAPHREAFDGVIWNNSDESDLSALGNPIPVELKATKNINVDMVAAACQRAQLQRHRAIILATTARQTKSVEQFVRQVFSVQDFVIITLDESVLNDVESSKDLLKATRSRLRNIVYGG